MHIKASCDKFLRSLVQDDDVREEVVSQISAAISRRENDLLQLVSALGEYLTNDDSTLRSKSMSLLQKVLGSVPSDLLTGQQIAVVTAFFGDRLSDDVCLEDTLAALIAVAQMAKFSSKDAETIALSTLQVIQDSQSLPQRVKFKIYTLFEKLMSRYRTALQALGQKFITGFSEFMSGEKDPRNLMLAFSIMKVILAEFETQFATQELFDVVYCYFPITFRPPTDEPSTITTEDLKGRLRDCLGATSTFAPYLIPALIEKLNAVAISVKKDSLLTIKHCCIGYSAQILNPYAPDLWQALKFEIIQSEDSLLEELAIEVLTSVTACFAEGRNDMPKACPLSRWMQPIVLESLEQLREPELKSAKPCGKILYSVATASPLCLEVIIKAILPGLVALCQESKTAGKLATLFDVLLNLINALSLVLELQGIDIVERVCAEFISCRVDLLFLFLGGLLGEQQKDPQLRKVSITCLEQLVKVHHVLDSRDLSNLAQQLNEILLEEHREIRDATISVLLCIADIRVDIILDITIPALLANLPQDELQACSPSTHLALEALARLATRKEVMNCLIVRLLSRIRSCLAAGPPAKEYLLSLLHALYEGLDHYQAGEGSTAAQFYDKLAVQLYRLTFDNRTTIMTDVTVLQKTSKIINVICRQCSKEKQEAIAHDLFSVFLTNRENKLILSQDGTFSNFQAIDGNGKMNTIQILFVYTFASFRRDVNCVAHLEPNLVFQVIETARSTQKTDHRQLLCTLLTLIINKAASDKDISSLLQVLLTDIDLSSFANMQITFAIAKALILRSHPAFKDLVSSIVPELSNLEHGRNIACQFQELLEQGPLLTKENFACIKLLSKQKFYSFVIPVLMQSLNQSNADSRANFLIALSRVISLSPRAVILSDIHVILPVLLECSILSDIDSRRMAITTLDSIVLDCRESIGSHLSTLIPNLLMSIKQTDSTPPRTRMVSLHLLGSLVDIIRADKIQPFKARVIRALTASLDDRKRSVRKEAVITRQKYFTTL